MCHYFDKSISILHEQSQKNEIEFIGKCLESIKDFIATFHIHIRCSVCNQHYIQTSGMLIVHMEQKQVEYERFKRQHGTIERFDELDNGLIEMVKRKNYVTPGNIVIINNEILYRSWEFHNHVNGYKFIQQLKQGFKVENIIEKSTYYPWQTFIRNFS